jgi:hypothetical protein
MEPAARRAAARVTAAEGAGGAAEAGAAAPAMPLSSAGLSASTPCAGASSRASTARSRPMDQASRQLSSEEGARGMGLAGAVAFEGAPLASAAVAWPAGPASMVETCGPEGGGGAAPVNRRGP